MLIVTAVPKKTKDVVTGKRKKKKKRKYISRVLDRRISYTRIPDSYIILWPDRQLCHFHLYYMAVIFFF